MLFILNVLRVLLNRTFAGGPYFKSGLDFVEGTAFLIAAVGLIRFDAKLRIFAIFLSTISLAVAAVLLASLPVLILASRIGMSGVLHTAVWLLVLWWLLSTPPQAGTALDTKQSGTI